ncbi:hypothetical protein [Streptomyces sp. NRRL F-5065]|uniref:hypothetical protein n=1 Tax=Streptomyces sp. NRRL F-5065 TaxID=1463855 RepID=UPI0004C13CAA|nr:hypothetical protein [Streptomyces sp. NRRL F-5065]
MRLPVRRIATSVLCAGLLTGVCGTAVTAAEGAPPGERPTAGAPRAPLPDRDALRGQAGALSGLGGTLTPVADLLDAVLAADGGRLPAADAERLATAVRDALARAEGALPEASGNTGGDGASGSAAGGEDAHEGGTPGAGKTEPGDSSPQAVTPGTDASGADQTGAPGTGTGQAPPVTLPAPVAERDGGPAPLAGDLTADAYAALREKVDALVEAATAGTPDDVAPAAREVVAGAVDVVAATLTGKGLPAPDLGLLPALPEVPEAPGAPQTPGPADTPPADAS